MAPHWIGVILETCWTLSLQLAIVGGLAWVGCLWAGQPRGPRRATNRRRELAILAAAWPSSIACALATAGVGWLAFGRLWPVEPVSLVAPGVSTLVGGVATASAYGLFESGRLETRGARGPAARLVRRAGKSLFGAVGVLWLLLLVSRLQPDATRLTGPALDTGSFGLLLAGMLGLGFAAAIGLLAGLSGKPRPSGTFAVILYTSGWVLIVAGG